MAKLKEPRRAAGLGLVGVDRKGIVTPSARMRHVIRAAADRAGLPKIDKIEHQRRVDGDRRMQARGRMPGTIAHRRHKLTDAARWMQRQSAAVAGDGETL